jgi:CHAD domain-containing protein
MKIGKNWIKARKPHDPIADVAQHALENRLRSVRHFLPLAADRPKEDVEYVHRLRVATRRAAAALRAFEDMASKPRTREIERALRKARQAAGAARDLDVLAARLATEGTWPQTVRFIGKLRDKVQRPLQRVQKKLKRRGFQNQARKLVRSIRWRGSPPEPSYVDFARTALRPSVDRFFAASAEDLSHTEALHAMRIAGKQLRYDMELYAAAFDHSFRTEFHEVFKEVQDKLGAINDHATAAVLFDHWRESTQKADLVAELKALGDREWPQIADSVAEFCQWWTPERAAGLQQSFQRFIAPQESNGQAPVTPADHAGDPAHRTRDELNAVTTRN